MNTFQIESKIVKDIQKLIVFKRVNHITAKKITADQAFELYKGYNEQTWKTIIERLKIKMTDLKFYHVEGNKIISYDRLYASYKTPEGLHVLTDVCYSSSLTSARFKYVRIVEENENVYFEVGELQNGDPFGYENNEGNRKVLAESGIMFSNKF